MQIKVIQPENHRLCGKTYRGYKPLARVLKIGERVTVAVYGPPIGKFGRILEGYGEVARLDADKFERPRRLMMEY